MHQFSTTFVICLSIRKNGVWPFIFFERISEGTDFDIDEVADEMFSDGMGISEMDDSGNASGMLMDLSANEKTVHADFFNDFDDLFDDDNDD